MKYYPDMRNTKFSYAKIPSGLTALYDTIKRHR